MPVSVYYIIHVVGLILLSGILFASFAAPHPEFRRRSLIFSGIISLLVFVAGFGLSGILEIGFPLWLWIKLFCWLVLTCLVGMSFRFPQKVRFFFYLSLITLVVAVSMVYLKPFV